MLKDAEMNKPAGATKAEPEVPFVDLKSQYFGIRDEILKAFAEVLDNTAYILGPKVKAFEEAFARYVGAKHCIALNTGTSALHLALQCAGVGPGDEVITIPMTFIATSWGVSYCGATPVFVDVDPITYTMDPAQVEARISKKTKAILPVHLYGQPCDLQPLLEIGKKHGIPVIEDAAQAHGAEYAGKRAGSMGQSGCFSFYPGKNLGAYGEGGAIVTNDDDLAKRMLSLRDHAQTPGVRYYHHEVGYNYRMDGLQGAVLGVKLPHLEKWTESRRRLAARYQQLLAEPAKQGLLQLPIEATGRRHVYHLYVILHPKRDQLQKMLKDRGINSGLHYPVPLHHQTPYKGLNHPTGGYPVSERVGRECLSLPMFPEMTDTQQDRVVRELLGCLKEVQ